MAENNGSQFPKLVKNRKRFDQILRTLMKYGLADWVGDWNPEYVKGLFRTDQGQDVRALPPARRLRLALTELGTTFIKLGQMMSTRADMVGPDMAKELSSLQADVPPDPPEVFPVTVELSTLAVPALKMPLPCPPLTRRESWVLVL